MPKPIAEQCKERGLAVPVGITAADARDMGFDVEFCIPESAVLCREGDDPPMDTKIVGTRTGYYWRFHSQGMC